MIPHLTFVHVCKISILNAYFRADLRLRANHPAQRLRKVQVSEGESAMTLTFKFAVFMVICAAVAFTAGSFVALIP